MSKHDTEYSKFQSAMAKMHYQMEQRAKEKASAKRKGGKKNDKNTVPAVS